MRKLQLFFFFSIAILFGGLVQFGQPKFIVYNTSQGTVSDKLNVHVVAHTHDDVGWLKTVDQYYVGSNNSIQGACVQNILDSLIPALLADKNRKFIYVEQVFFQRWWRDQSEIMQGVVKELVSSGQLEFINGGMCMHDEAVTHYVDMIDQTTLGHRFIKRDFGVVPRIGWQIDPFGHSSVQAYLLGYELGFDSLFFGRIDYQDRIKRKREKSLEVVWQGSKSFGSSAQIFAGAFPENYEPPPGDFYFEVNDVSPVVQDDVDLFDYNVQERVNDFVSAAVAQANITRTNHVMFTMGTDFKYQYANSWFRQLDKLIHYVNLDGRVNALYSTPSIYTDAKHSANQEWPLKTDDFFPYADRDNAYWTGYFSSRPALKRYVRMMSGYYMAARQLEFLRGRRNGGPNTDSLGDAMAISQHHDAVTGTEKQHVADDYAKRLSIGYSEAENVVSDSLTFLVHSSEVAREQTSTTKFKQCPLLNVSYCEASETGLSEENNLIVVVYNSLGWKREEVIRFPILYEEVTVLDCDGKEVESQVIPVLKRDSSYRKGETISRLNVEKYWLSFSVSVPPLGFISYIISSEKPAGSGSTKSNPQFFNNIRDSPIRIGKRNLEISLSSDDGKSVSHIRRRNSIQETVEQSFLFYAAYNGTADENPQNAGAYIFRPNGSSPLIQQDQEPFTVFHGPVMDEIHQKINDWIYKIIRIYKEQEHVEVEFIVGPVPIDDGIGKEVVTEIRTQIESNKTFFTDSNGRDFIKRVRDFRADWNLEVNQPIAGNYYPVNLGIYLKDNSKELSILVDRPLGASSTEDGQVELMLHRRLLLDDSRGVGEALNETVCIDENWSGLTIRGKYYLRIDPLGEGAKWRRTFGQQIYSPLVLAFAEGDQNWMNSHVSKFSAIDSSYSLPDNVAIITLQELDDGKILLRLAHLYEVGEDDNHSIIAEVEIKKLFPDKEIDELVETNLSANQEKAEMEKKRLRWTAEQSQNKETAPVRGGAVDLATMVVELGPMEIRTFLIGFGDGVSSSNPVQASFVK